VARQAALLSNIVSLLLSAGAVSKAIPLFWWDGFLFMLSNFFPGITSFFAPWPVL